MTSVNPSLNLNFAAAEAARLAFAERGAEEALAAQLRNAGQTDALAVGTTITARYQYKVGADGALLPVQTQITTEAPGNRGELRRQARDSLRQNDPERPPRFGDLAKPKPQLSPTDEVAVFAAADAELLAAQANSPLRSEATKQAVPTPATLASIATAAEVVDEEGEAIEAQLITPQAPNAQSPKFGVYTQAQSAVAGLYARNYDITFSVSPLQVLAA